MSIKILFMDRKSFSWEYYFKIKYTDNNTEYVVYVHEYATKYTFTVKYSLNGYFNIVLDNTSYIHNIIVEFIKNTIKMDKLCQ